MLNRRTAFAAEGTWRSSQRCLVMAHCPRRGLPVVAANLFCRDVATQRLDLLLIAVVMPRDDRSNGGPVFVDEDAGFTHAGDANGRCDGRAGAGVQRRPECFDRGIEQLLGGEFHAVRRGNPWGAGTSLADDLALISEDDRFRRRGPHVKSHQKCHVQNLRGCRGGDVVIIRRAGAGQSDRLPSMATFRYGDHRRPASNA